MIKKADSFTVTNPEWTYGKKVVVLASDYEKLWEAFEQAQRLLTEARNRSMEWEKAARHARNMVGSIKVVK
jgi:hypothetical protein